MKQEILLIKQWTLIIVRALDGLTVNLQTNVTEDSYQISLKSGKNLVHKENLELMYSALQTLENKVNDFILIGKVRNLDFPNSIQKKSNQYVKTRTSVNYENLRDNYNDTIQTSMESVESHENMDDSPSKPMVKLLLDRAKNSKVPPKPSYNQDLERDDLDNDYFGTSEDK
uniref:Uncharacterized protein n=1 Tax=Euplotes crassus TaxID=5936 RepID=A0A7S3NZ81_EUPCR|mmetsp:Transcript_3314/g.3039  ORF Transcript_3314/g.3039 Transcript_3314/m.3039 type:complete len:171 (+) Transcript_3314:105-617(+)